MHICQRQTGPEKRYEPARIQGEVPPPSRTETPQTSAARSEIDALSKAVLAALASKDSATLYALVPSAADIQLMLEATRKACPDKVPADADPDKMAAEMSKQLGTDAQRKQRNQTDYAQCQKVASFAKATFVKAVAKGLTLDCATGNAGHRSQRGRNAGVRTGRRCHQDPLGLEAPGVGALLEDASVAPGSRPFAFGPRKARNSSPGSRIGSAQTALDANHERQRPEKAAYIGRARSPAA